MKDKEDKKIQSSAWISVAIVVLAIIAIAFFTLKKPVAQKKQITTTLSTTTIAKTTSTIPAQIYTSCIIRTWNYGNGTIKKYCYPINPEKVPLDVIKKNV